MKNNVTLRRFVRIIIASLILIYTVFAIISCGPKEVGNVARVTVDGEVVGEYPLSVNGVYTINGGTNILTVENGIAYMSYSNCPDHVCEKTGKVKYVGEQIVCLPNKVTVTVSGEIPGDSGVDFVS